MPASDLEIVAVLTEKLRQRIGEQRFDLWFENKTKFQLTAGGLNIGVPNRFYQEWLHKTFSVAIEDVCAQLLGSALPVEFSIDAQLFQAARQQETLAQQPKRPSHGKEAAKSNGVSVPEPPVSRRRKRRWRHLADFIVGPCNRVGHAAAMSVVESPDMCPIPLVLYGSVGTGKTHILEGIYAELRRRYPDWRICFATAEEFTHRFVQAMRLQKIEPFRKQYRDCDVFLLDDLHFLETKRATQEEFLHTLDALQAEQCPVVVSCDCHPRVAEQYCPELTDRLIGGTAWELALPDLPTRKAILQAKSREKPLAETVLQFIAEKLTGNVRELEGAIHTLSHFQRFNDGPLDVTKAEEALRDLLQPSAKQVELADIEEVVCRTLGLDKKALQSKSRDWQVAHPRMLAMHLARKHTGAAFNAIGRHFGNRNHSTVVAACKKVGKWMEAGETMILGGRRVPVREVIERVERGLG